MELTLQIEGPAAGGSTVARHEGQVVFVSGALPGETVRARTEPGSSAKFLRAEVTEVLEASAHRAPDRRPPFLTDDSHRLFGGMEFAHVDLAHSRVLKAEIISDQLSRIAHLDREVEVASAPGESDGMHWRTRVQLAVDTDSRLGMLAPRTHEVVPLTSAPLSVPPIAEVALSRLRLPGADRLEFAWASGHGAAIVRGDCEPSALDDLTAALPEQWSILTETARTSRGATRRRGSGKGPGPGLSVLRGQAHLNQHVSGRDFRVAADGFWQVHDQAASLLSTEVNAALTADVESGGIRSITDLYCGVGLLGIGAAAATGARLYGVEGSKTAIENARVNAHGLDAAFDALRADRARIPACDAIILDPPRAGAGKAVTRALLESSARTIVYVSCDAATLARDLAALTAGGLKIESLRGFDLFPLTSHVETVTVLRR